MRRLNWRRHARSNAGSNRGNPRRRLPKWAGPAILAGVLVLAAGIWMLPRRTEEVVSAAGEERWHKTEAPPRRQIVWQPAKTVETALPKDQQQAEFAHPQLADAGLTLYYTVRGEGESADIYRSMWQGEGWSVGQPVAELNTPADDYGPRISADGTTLYLYSNRPGGEGGFDIYTSTKSEDGWTPPVNLGPRVNTAAHEYAPSISPDGERLFYASNRTRRMQQQAEKHPADASDDQAGKQEWSATLRAEAGLREFDLYVARREDPGHWSAPLPLESVNTAANEGEPQVSPNGAFLYFTSDRPNPHGDARNYDVYRGRLHGDAVVAVENLGSGVNTADDEHEPTLSPEGFRLVFSSNRLPDTGDAADLGAEDLATADVPYALYESRAIEVFDETGWDTSHVSALANYWWWFLLALLLAALLAALIWYIREVSLRRATVPGFLLSALLLHLLLASGTFFVVFGEGVVEEVRRRFKEAVVASEPVLESTRRPEEPRFEEVADLSDVETAKPQAAPKQSAPRANRTPSNLRPKPMRKAQLQPDQPTPNVATFEAPPESSREEPLLQRRRPAIEELASAQPIEMMKTQQQTDAQSEQQQLAKVTPQLQRQQVNKTARRTPVERREMKVEPTVQPESPEAISAPEPAPEQSQPANPVDRLASRNAPSFEVQPVQPTPTQAAPAQSTSESAAAGSQQSVKLDVSRQASKTSNAQPLKSSSRPARVANAPTPFEASNVQVDNSMPAPDSPAETAQSPLVRERGMAAEVEAVARIELDATAGAAASPSSIASDTVAPQAKVHVDRASSSSTRASLSAAGAARPQTATGEKLLTPSELTGAAEMAEWAAAPSSAGSLNLVRSNFVPDAGAEAGQPIELVSTSTSAGTPASSSEAQAIVQANVKVQRGSQPAGSSSAKHMRAKAQQSTTSAVGEGTPLDPIAAKTSAPESATDALNDIFRRRNSQAADGPESAEISLLPTGTPVEVSGDVGGDNSAERLNGVAIDAQRQAVEGSAGRPALESLVTQRDGDIAGVMPGELAAVNFDSRPQTGPLDSPFSRRNSPKLLAKYAQNRIGLEAMLRLRIGDDETKKDLIDAFGGDDDATLAAIRRGLAWLAKAQMEDGHWDLRRFRHTGKRKFADTNSITAATGLGLLPFLGDGQTHFEGRYKDTVDRGLRWLVDHQKDNGDLFTGGEGNAHMYSHAIAAIALCEAYGLTRDEALKSPAQAGIDFIVEAQHKDGGWRYHPNQKGDTSVFGWQIMALKSAQMAGLDVPGSTLDRARRYLKKARRGGDSGEFGYQPGGGGKPAMTAEGLLCMEYLGTEKTDPYLQNGIKYLANRPPAKGKDTSYYWYYGTQTLFHYQGEPWRRWNENMNPTLLATQQVRGDMAGAWPARDNWEERAGPLYATSLRLLMLEVYVRHLPLYQLEQ